MLERRIADVIHWREDVIVATYAKATGVEVHVTARAIDRRQAEQLRDEAETMLRERLGDNVFGTGGETLSEAVAEILAVRNRTLATMESATGGQLSDLITNNAGSSEYFLGGIVAYTREVKERYGVAPAILDRFGMISGETAQAMADAICRVLGADIGLATSGIAGTEPVEEKPPGTCYVAVSMDGVRQVREIHRPAERDIAKRFFSQCALDLLRRQLISTTRVGASGA
jgi:nicotinamide-nucleotide amidase